MRETLSAPTTTTSSLCFGPTEPAVLGAFSLELESSSKRAGKQLLSTFIRLKKKQPVKGQSRASNTKKILR